LKDAITGKYGTFFLIKSDRTDKAIGFFNLENWENKIKPSENRNAGVFFALSENTTASCTLNPGKEGGDLKFGLDDGNFIKLGDVINLKKNRSMEDSAILKTDLFTCDSFGNVKNNG
jgi:hypothetical protein